MAVFRRAPAAQHFPFQRFQFLHQFGAAEEVFFELLDAAVSAVLADLERIGPDTGHCARHIVVMPSDVDMVGVLEPLKQVLVTHLAQELDLYVDHRRLALLALLRVPSLLRLLFRQLQPRLLLLLEGRPFLLGLEELLLDVLDLLWRLHYSFTK